MILKYPVEKHFSLLPQAGRALTFSLMKKSAKNQKNRSQPTGHGQPNVIRFLSTALLHPAVNGNNLKIKGFFTFD
jgi:hypothetical protein